MSIKWLGNDPLMHNLAKGTENANLSVGVALYQIPKAGVTLSEATGLQFESREHHVPRSSRVSADIPSKPTNVRGV